MRNLKCFVRNPEKRSEKFARNLNLKNAINCHLYIILKILMIVICINESYRKWQPSRNIEAGEMQTPHSPLPVHGKTRTIDWNKYHKMNSANHPKIGWALGLHDHNELSLMSCLEMKKLPCALIVCSKMETSWLFNIFPQIRVKKSSLEHIKRNFIVSAFEIDSEKVISRNHFNRPFVRLVEWDLTDQKRKLPLRNFLEHMIFARGCFGRTSFIVSCSFLRNS